MEKRKGEIMKKIKCRVDIITISLEDDFFSCTHEIVKCESLTKGELVIKQSHNCSDPNSTTFRKLTPLYD